MSDLQLVKVDGKWGVYTFAEGLKFSPRACSDKRVSDETDDVDDHMTPYSNLKELETLVISLVREGKFHEAYQALEEKFPEWKSTNTRPSA